MSDTQSRTPQKKKRSGSEKRQRAKPISVRVNDDERAKIEANAAAADLCPSAYLRVAGTGTQRSSERRRPTVDMTLLAQAMAQVGRIGGNLAQFLRLANRGEIVAANDLDAAVQEARAFIAEAQKALRG
jgi:hypothetical protein